MFRDENFLNFRNAKVARRSRLVWFSVLSFRNYIFFLFFHLLSLFCLFFLRCLFFSLYMYFLQFNLSAEYCIFVIEMISPVVVYVWCEVNTLSRYFSRGFEVIFGVLFNPQFSEL
jgi:hypothetical protein